MYTLNKTPRGALVCASVALSASAICVFESGIETVSDEAPRWLEQFAHCVAFQKTLPRPNRTARDRDTSHSDAVFRRGTWSSRPSSKSCASCPAREKRDIYIYRYLLPPPRCVGAPRSVIFLFFLFVSLRAREETSPASRHRSSAQGLASDIRRIDRLLNSTRGRYVLSVGTQPRDTSLTATLFHAQRFRDGGGARSPRRRPRSLRRNSTDIKNQRDCIQTRRRERVKESHGRERLWTLARRQRQRPRAGTFVGMVVVVSSVWSSVRWSTPRGACRREARRQDAFAWWRLRVSETVSGFGTIDSVLESHGPCESFELSKVQIGPVNRAAVELAERPSVVARESASTCDRDAARETRDVLETLQPHVARLVRRSSLSLSLERERRETQRVSSRCTVESWRRARPRGLRAGASAATLRDTVRSSLSTLSTSLSKLEKESV